MVELLGKRGRWGYDIDGKEDITKDRRTLMVKWALTLKGT